MIVSRFLQLIWFKYIKADITQIRIIWFIIP